MASVFSTLIYIGNFAEMDTNEGNFTNESETVAGTYTNADMELFTLEFVDDNNDGLSPDDDIGAPTPDTVNYDVGGGPQSQFIDSTSVYNATVLLGDNSSFTASITVIQMQNGDVFMAEFDNDSSLDGLNIQSITLDPSPNTDYASFFNDSSISGASVVCFTRHSLIQTDTGPRPIARLNVGDLVMTLDHGLRPVAWIGGQFHAYPGPHAPIRIAAGALGDGTPAQPLLVSPQHRVMLRNKVAERMFGEAEVLMAAKALLGLPGVRQEPPDRALTYWHLAFDAHEVIMANGAWAEALYPGPMACHALPEAALEELRILMPGFGLSGAQMPLARPCPPMRQQTKLIERLTKNGQMPVSSL